MLEGRKRGVIFDVGHGGGSFAWRIAVPAIKEGFLPDSISTDLHIGSMNSGMKDMLNVMSKFLAMGMSLDDVIARSTWNPAREIHREELGHLSVGSLADVAVLRVETRRFRLHRYVRRSPEGRSQTGLRVDTSRWQSSLRPEWPHTPGLDDAPQELSKPGRCPVGCDHSGSNTPDTALSATIKGILPMNTSNTQRRDFLKATGLAVAAGFPAILKGATVTNAIKVGLVGCGGRGSGAASQALAADDYAELTAVADIDQAQIDHCLNALKRIASADQVKVEKANQFLGLDAYQKVIDAAWTWCCWRRLRASARMHLRRAIDAEQARLLREAGRHRRARRPLRPRDRRRWRSRRICRWSPASAGATTT